MGGKERWISLGIHLYFCSIFKINPPGSNYITETSIKHRAFKSWHKVGTHSPAPSAIGIKTHADTESNTLPVKEIYGRGAPNNSIKTKLDWCGTDRLQNSGPCSGE